MGVAGLTSYVNNNLRGAVAMEDLREVRSGVRNGELENIYATPWFACKILPFARRRCA